MSAKKPPIPTTEEIRRDYADTQLFTEVAADQFDRWLKKHDRELLKAESDKHTHLIAELFNGFQISVFGMSASIDVLKSFLLPSKLLKSIRVYRDGEYVTKYNYTQIKAIREASDRLKAEKEAARESAD